MKKVYLIGLAVASLFLGSKAEAFTWDYDVGVVNYKIAVAANISTYTVLVDLSDTTNWPHKNAKSLEIKRVKILVDKTAASTCTVRLGVVNHVNASTGSVTWFTGLQNERNVSNTNNALYHFLDNTVYNLTVYRANNNQTEGATPFLLSNEVTTASTIFQNDVRLPAPIAAGVIPAVGDLVLQVLNGAVAVEVYVEVQYYGNN